MSSAGKHVIVTGSFDDLRSPQIRFLEESSRLGNLTVLLWNDAAVRRLTGAPPKFPEAERQYLLQSIRFVSQVKLTDAAAGPHALSGVDLAGAQLWAVEPSQDHVDKKTFCVANQLEYRAFAPADLKGFPEPPARPSAA